MIIYKQEVTKWIEFIQLETLEAVLDSVGEYVNSIVQLLKDEVSEVYNTYIAQTKRLGPKAKEDMENARITLSQLNDVCPVSIRAQVKHNLLINIATKKTEIISSHDSTKLAVIKGLMNAPDVMAMVLYSSEYRKHIEVSSIDYMPEDYKVALKEALLLKYGSEEACKIAADSAFESTYKASVAKDSVKGTKFGLWKAIFLGKLTVIKSNIMRGLGKYKVVLIVAGSIAGIVALTYLGKRLIDSFINKEDASEF